MFDRPGRVWAPRPGRRLNLGSGSDVRPAHEGWVNLDGFYKDPSVVQHDIGEIPLPFPDNHFDYVYASHVLEHIPLVYRDWGGVQRDVLFALMEDLHRILKPGGVLHVLVPWGGTASGLSHPQHYRQWRPEWFRWFHQEGVEGRGYHSADFQLGRMRYNRSGFRWRYILPLGPSRMGLAEHLVIRFPRLFGWLHARQEIEAWLMARKAPGADA